MIEEILNHISHLIDVCRRWTLESAQMRANRPQTTANAPTTGLEPPNILVAAPVNSGETVSVDVGLDQVLLIGDDSTGLAGVEYEGILP